jgi:hypothetical protein
MAARQALMKRAPNRPVLEKLLEAARKVRVSDEEFFEQHISFAYGNAPEGSTSTKDSIRQAASRLWLSRY